MSSLWTLARVGRTYCADVRRQRGWFRRSTKRETPTRTGLPRARASRYFVFPSPTSPLSLSPLTVFLSLNVLYFGPTHHHNHHHHTGSSQREPPPWTSPRFSWSLVRATSPLSLTLLLSTTDVHLLSLPLSLPVSLLSSFRLFRFDSRNGSASRCRWVNTNRRAGDLCMGWS